MNPTMLPIKLIPTGKKNSTPNTLLPIYIIPKVVMAPTTDRSIGRNLRILWVAFLEQKNCAIAKRMNKMKVKSSRIELHSFFFHFTIIKSCQSNQLMLKSFQKLVENME